MDRQTLARHWDQAWEEGLWATPWSRVLEGLTAEQAAWRAAPDRHCIWEYVSHMLFWREVALRRLRGESIAAEERERRNFSMPNHPTEAEFSDLRARWEHSCRQMRDAILDGVNELSDLQYVGYHDSYHIGQVMLVRGLLGLKHIE